MHHDTLHSLISLYHGEVAAERAYEQAAGLFAGQPEEFVLQRLEAAHVVASRRLAAEIRMAGSVVPTPSGAWDPATFVNDDIALYVLTRSEQIAAQAYARALSSAEVPQPINRLLVDRMLECRSNLQDLQQLRAPADAVEDRPLM